MYRRLFLILGLLVMGGAWSGCDSTTEFDRDDEIVVESYLVAERRFGHVRLSRVVPVEAQYSFETAAIRNAEVEIRRLDETGSVIETIVYGSAEGRPGLYDPLVDELVQPLSTYELFVRIPETGEAVTSRTIVPGAIRVVSSGPDTVVYQGATQHEVVLTRSSYPGRQAIFIFSNEGLEASIPNLTPFYREVVEPDNDADEDELDDVRVTESPPLNEDGYDINEDGTLTVKVPWLVFAFYGQNRLRANAIDDNLFDFVRSQAIQQGGSTLAPGEIPNILDHIDGGTGVFGSYAQASSEVYVRRSQ